MFGIEREFDRYYQRLKLSLKGGETQEHLLNDANMIDYAVSRTYNPEFAWGED